MSQTRPHDGCPDEATLVAHVRGEPTGIDAHLETCESCREKVRAFGGVVDALRSVPEEALQRDLTDDVLAKLPSPAPVWRRWPVLTAAAACVLGIVATFVLDYQQTTENRPMPGIPGPVTQPQPQEVARALDWLVRTQEEDGSWNPKKWEGQELYRVGLTGLALLAFSGEDAGNANADAVGRAADYLVTQQDKSGRFGPFFSNAPYNHGIATVALLETWARTKDARLKQPIERALIFIGRHQHPTGGWGYLSIDRKINTSVTAWQLHAVLLADALGWPEARPSVEKGLAWIAGVVDREGRAGYERTGDFPEGPKALTAMAAFCLSVGAKHPTETAADAAVVRSLAKIADDATDAEKVDFYRSYFLSHALGVARRRGFSEGTKLGDLTAQLNRTLAARQLTEGPNAGSWDPADQWSSAGGRVYATAMAALSLQSENRTERLTGRIRRH